MSLDLRTAVAAACGAARGGQHGVIAPSGSRGAVGHCGWALVSRLYARLTGLGWVALAA